MKKTILTIMLTSLFFVPMGLSQEETKVDIPAKTDTAEQDQKDKVLSTLETAKSGQIKIEKNPEQLAKEKKEIEQQKTDLVTNGSAESAGDPEVKRKLKLLEEQQQLIEAKEMAIGERIQATEQVIAVIERKIDIINREDLNLYDIRRESKEMRRSLGTAEKEKAFLKSQIPLINMEMKAIEKELAGQKMLRDLKEKDKDKDVIIDSIKANELRLTAGRAEVDLINERAAFINVRIELAKDYLSVLWEKRLEIMKNIFLIPRAYAFYPLDIVLLLIFFVCLIFMLVIRRKPEEGGTQEGGQAPHAGFSIRSSKKIFLGGMVFSVMYFILSFIKFHQLAMYLTCRTALIVAVTLTFWGVQRLIRMLFKKIISTGKEGSKERIMMKTVLGILGTISGWGLFFLGGFIVVDTLGMSSEAVDLFIRVVQKPFFTLGSVNISAWLLFKAVVILWVFIAGANLIDVFLRKSVYKRVHLDDSVQYTFSVTIKYVMLIIGLLIGLSALGVELAALTVFAGTIGIGIGFGLQDVAKNFIGGLVMLVERPVKVGDYIEVGGLPGKVKAIKASSTIVDTFDNISVIVPNAEFMNQKVINWSYSDKITRLKLSVGVAYGTDTELVKTTLLTAAKNHPDILKRPEPYVWFTEFGDSALHFELYVWTIDPNHRFTIKSQINFEINRLFNEKGIRIPFPQRDLHFKSTDVSLK